MQIDNKEYLFKVRKVRMFATIGTLATGLIIVLIPEIDTMLFSGSRYVISATLLGIYLAFNLIRLTKEYYFVQFNDENNELLIKFFHIKMIGRKYKAFKIPLDQIYDFEISKQYLTITQRIGNKAGKLPAVSLKAYSKEKTEKVREMLNFYKLLK